jgi:NADPH:quinone reductase-like Zn-dependent oxidoreductase
MRAVICRAWGEVDDLRVEEVAAPHPGPGEVLIAVKATAVNYADALMTAGRYLQWWYEAGKLRPCISHRLPLEKSVEAIRLLTERRAYGKVVVVPGLQAD